jgi:glyoxylase-like metal-dependent hydrolase (beta-lactamase superfamily II)
MKLYTIETGNFKLDGGAMFGVVPKTIWNQLNPADEKNLCTWAMRSLLIEEGDRLILIDNGCGDKQNDKFFSYYYLDHTHTLESSLSKHGFGKEDITDVVLTHLHFDHCGGSIIRVGETLVPAFKNAVYWSNERHWEWAIHPNDREKASFLKENILPIQQSGQLKMVDFGNQTTGMENSEWGEDCPPQLSAILPELSFRLVNGHTDAMMLPQIKYKDQTVVFMADLIPSTGHIPIPYVAGYDMFPLKSMNEKKSFLTEALEKNYILFFEHDPVNECCRLQLTEKGIRHKEIFALEEL